MDNVKEKKQKPVEKTCPICMGANTITDYIMIDAMPMPINRTCWHCFGKGKIST